VFVIVEELKFLLEIITLVSSANKMGTDKKHLLLQIGHLYVLRKAKALKLTSGELHVSLIPILR
jgi:hypothetical protein